MQLLLVSPDAELATTQELLTAMSGMRVVSLIAPVTLREVLTQIQTNTFDGIHFAGHGSAELLEFAEGPAGIALLISAFNRATNLKFVVLNSCASLAAAVDIYVKSTTIEAIGWPANVPDMVAQEWAVSFYRALQISKSIGDSVATANQMIAATFPGTQEVRLLNGRLGETNAAFLAAQVVARDALAAAEKVKVTATIEATAIRANAQAAVEALAKTEAQRSRGAVPFWLGLVLIVVILILVYLLARQHGVL